MLLTACDDESIKGIHALIVLAPVAFSFFHISTFMLMPFFTAIFWLMYLDRRNKKYIIDLFTLLVFFALGFWMMLDVAIDYSYSNLSRMFIGPINKNTLWLVPVVYDIIALTISSILIRCKKFNIKSFFESRACKWIIRIVIVLSLAYVAYFIWRVHLDAEFGMKMHMWLRKRYGGNGRRIIVQYTALFATCIMSGIVIVPMAILSIFINPAYYLKRKNVLVFAGFFYLVLLVNVYVRKEVYYYYYYARYLEYVVPIAILIGGMFIEKTQRALGISMAIVGLAVMLPYSYYLAANPYDDSFMPDRELLNICSELKPGAAIIFDCEDDFIRNVAIDIKEIADCDIYPVFDDIDSEIEKFSEEYNKVYIISDLIYHSSYNSAEYKIWSANDIIPLIDTIGVTTKIVNIYDLDNYALGE